MCIRFNLEAVQSVRGAVGGDSALGDASTVIFIAVVYAVVVLEHIILKCQQH